MHFGEDPFSYLKVLRIPIYREGFKTHKEEIENFINVLFDDSCLISKVTRLQYWLEFMAEASFWKNSYRSPALDKWISWNIILLIEIVHRTSRTSSYLQWHRFRDNGQDLVQDFVGQLLGVGTRSQLGEPGVVFQCTGDIIVTISECFKH